MAEEQNNNRPKRRVRRRSPEQMPQNDGRVRSIADADAENPQETDAQQRARAQRRARARRAQEVRMAQDERKEQEARMADDTVGVVPVVSARPLPVQDGEDDEVSVARHPEPMPDRSVAEENVQTNEPQSASASQPDPQPERVAKSAAAPSDSQSESTSGFWVESRPVPGQPAQAPKSASASQPASVPTPQPQPASQPASQPAPQPQPASQPASQPAPQPQPASQPASQPAPTPQPQSAPVPQPAPQPQPQSASMSQPVIQPEHVPVAPRRPVPTAPELDENTTAEEPVFVDASYESVDDYDFVDDYYADDEQPMEDDYVDEAPAPRRTRNRRERQARDTRGMRGVPVFWICYAVLVAALVAFGAFAIWHTYDSLVRYENAQPQGYVDGFVADLKAGGSAAEARRAQCIREDNIGQYDSIEKLNELFDKGVGRASYRVEEGGIAFDTSAPIYTIYADEKPFLSIHLEPGATYSRLSLLTITDWQISHAILHTDGVPETASSQIDEGLSYDVSVPANASVTVNGKVMDASATEGAATVMPGFEYASQFVDVPTATTYHLTGLVTEPEVTAANFEGAPITLNRTEAGYAAATLATPNREPSQLPIDPLKVAEDWSLFMTNDLGSGVSGVTQYLIPGSELYDQATSFANSIDITFVWSHSFTGFSDESVTNCIMYNDKLFSCDVRCTKNMTLSSGEFRPDVFANTMIFAYVDNSSVPTPGWYLVNMQAITQTPEATDASSTSGTATTTDASATATGTTTTTTNATTTGTTTGNATTTGTAAGTTTSGTTTTGTATETGAGTTTGTTTTTDTTTGTSTGTSTGTYDTTGYDTTDTYI